MPEWPHFNCSPPCNPYLVGVQHAHRIDVRVSARGFLRACATGTCGCAGQDGHIPGAGPRFERSRCARRDCHRDKSWDWSPARSPHRTRAASSSFRRCRMAPIQYALKCPLPDLCKQAIVLGAVRPCVRRSCWNWRCCRDGYGCGSCSSIETATSSASETLGSQEVRELPVNRRNVANLLSLAPGVRSAVRRRNREHEWCRRRRHGHQR